MMRYRTSMDAGEPSPIVTQPQPSKRVGAIQSLAKRLGFEEEMEPHEERSPREETVDDEFFRYNNATLSHSGVDILTFWAVSTISPHN